MVAVSACRRLGAIAKVQIAGYAGLEVGSVQAMKSKTFVKRQPLLFPVILVGVLVLVPVGAFAAEGLARFPLLSNQKPNPQILVPLGREFDQMTVRGVTVVAGRELRQRLGGKPGKLLSRCGADLVCIAELGRRAKVREVMLARASPAASGGLLLTVLVVDSKLASVKRRVSLTFRNPEDVSGVLRRSVRKMFGAKASLMAKKKAVEQPAPTAQTRAKSQTRPKPQVYAKAPARLKSQARAKSQARTKSPRRTKSWETAAAPDEIASASHTGETQPPEDLALVDPTAPDPPLHAEQKSPIVAMQQTVSTRTAWPLYTGLTLTGAGLASVAGGLAFFSKARSLQKTGTPGETTLAKVRKSRVKQASSAQRLGNVFLLSGITAALVGLGLTGFSFLDSDGDAVSVSSHVQVDMFSTGEGGFLQLSILY